MRAASNNTIEFKNVSYTVSPSRRILSEVNFSVARGETVVLLGRSGSGKTTTLKLINRLLDPTGGEVLVDGQRTTDWDPIKLRRRIGYVIQEAGLFPHYTVARNVALVPSLEGWDSERTKRRVHELLELAGLDPAEFQHRFPFELSGGQKQRVGVARALAADPPILLMDEPFGALDAITRVEMQDELRSLQKRLGKTIIFVTHDVREALLLGGRIALFSEGRVLFLGSAEAFTRSVEPGVSSFLKCLQSLGIGSRKTSEVR